MSRGQNHQGQPFLMEPKPPDPTDFPTIKSTTSPTKSKKRHGSPAGGHGKSTKLSDSMDSTSSSSSSNDLVIDTQHISQFSTQSTTNADRPSNDDINLQSILNESLTRNLLINVNGDQLDVDAVIRELEQQNEQDTTDPTERTEPDIGAKTRTEPDVTAKGEEVTVRAKIDGEATEGGITARVGLIETTVRAEPDDSVAGGDEATAVVETGLPKNVIPPTDQDGEPWTEVGPGGKPINKSKQSTPKNSPTKTQQKTTSPKKTTPNKSNKQPKTNTGKQITGTAGNLLAQHRNQQNTQKTDSRTVKPPVPNSSGTQKPSIPPKPQSFANVVGEQKKERFAGENTVTTSLKQLAMKFEPALFIRDLKKQHPLVIPAIESLGHRDRSEYELSVKSTHKHVLKDLIVRGVDSHNAHMTFKPDIPDAISVTLFGVPHEMDDQSVHNVMNGFGEVRWFFRHREKTEGVLYYTGRRIYGMKLARTIPKQIYIRGHQINTMYTGQIDELKREENEHNERLRQKQQQRQQRRNKQHTARTVTEEGETFTKSFMHEEGEPQDAWETTTKTLYNTFDTAHNENKLTVIDKNPTDRKTTFFDTNTNTKMRKMDITTKEVVAMIEGEAEIYNKLPSVALEYRELRGLSLLAQFGILRDFESTEFDDCPPNVVELWRDWCREFFGLEEGTVSMDDFMQGIYGKFEEEIKTNFQHHQIVIPASLPCW